MRNETYSVENWQKAYVVFENNTTLWWLKFLKAGYRHCYILLCENNKKSWLEINPLSNQIFVYRYNFEKEFDYPLYLKNCCQKTFLEINIVDAPYKTAPIGFFTCVEFVKRFIGIHSGSIITPYQLYIKILSCRKKVLT